MWLLICIDDKINGESVCLSVVKMNWIVAAVAVCVFVPSTHCQSSPIGRYCNFLVSSIIYIDSLG